MALWHLWHLWVSPGVHGALHELPFNGDIVGKVREVRQGGPALALLGHGGGVLGDAGDEPEGAGVDAGAALEVVVVAGGRAPDADALFLARFSLGKMLN